MHIMANWPFYVASDQFVFTFTMHSFVTICKIVLVLLVFIGSVCAFLQKNREIYHVRLYAMQYRRRV